MPGQYTQFATQTGSDHRLNGLRKYTALGCYYFELECGHIKKRKGKWGKRVTGKGKENANHSLY
jgi:hypothetical protein